MAYIKATLSEADCGIVAEAAKKTGLTPSQMAGALIRLGITTLVAQSDMRIAEATEELLAEKAAEAPRETQALENVSKSPYGNR